MYLSERKGNDPDQEGTLSGGPRRRKEREREMRSQVGQARDGHLQFSALFAIVGMEKYEVVLVPHGRVDLLGGGGGRLVRLVGQLDDFGWCRFR